MNRLLGIVLIGWFPAMWLVVIGIAYGWYVPLIIIGGVILIGGSVILGAAALAGDPFRLSDLRKEK
jgi:hypothetical protein